MKKIISDKTGFPRLALNEVIAYECHIRGLTKDPSSGVVHKGTYKGVIERLDDIKNLGFNQLILMPAYEYKSAPVKIYGVPSHMTISEREQSVPSNYWGFEPGDYFHAKQYYAERNADEEFAELISAAHAKDMEIIMMIHFADDVDTQMMLDSLNNWVRAFHVDGFFLNVNPYYLKVISDQKKLRKTKLYVYDIDRNINYTEPERIAVYDPSYRIHLRRMLRGDEDGLKDFVNDLINNHDPFAHIISVTSHNGFTLADLYSFARKHNEANGEGNRDGEDYNYSDNCGAEGASDDERIKSIRLRYMKNAICLLLLSKGIPVFLAGDEEGNSQKGNNNAYCQDNEISWIQYGGEYAGELKETVKQICALRRESGIFSNTSRSKINYRGIPTVSIHGSYAWDGSLDNVSRHAGILFADGDSYLYICVNFEDDDMRLAMPHLPQGFSWELLTDTADTQNACSDQSNTVLKGHSVKIFIGGKQ